MVETMLKVEKDVESDVESSSGDSDYCPSNDDSYSEPSAPSKRQRRSRDPASSEGQSRTLMRQWLIDLIDSGRIPGLHWIDDDKTLVHIPWLHASRHTFDTDKDSTLFREWAIHSGKFVPGEDEPDPKRWKANFRCAINSLSDVHEVKAQSCKKGHDAFKVYRFDVDKKRVAKKRPCPSSVQKTVVNADRKEHTKAKKLKTASGSRPAVARWLNQQPSDSYDDTYHDITGDEFGDTRTEIEVSPLDGCDVAGVYDHAAMQVAREETVVSSSATLRTTDVSLADIPLTVEEFSPRTPVLQSDVYETLYSSEACGSPLGSDTHSTDSGLSSSLTDESITEMMDEWQSEATCGNYFVQLTTVNISIPAGNDYNFPDTALAHPF